MMFGLIVISVSCYGPESIWKSSVTWCPYSHQVIVRLLLCCCTSNTLCLDVSCVPLFHGHISCVHTFPCLGLSHHLPVCSMNGIKCNDLTLYPLLFLSNVIHPSYRWMRCVTKHKWPFIWLYRSPDFFPESIINDRRWTLVTCKVPLRELHPW